MFYTQVSECKVTNNYLKKVMMLLLAQWKLLGCVLLIKQLDYLGIQQVKNHLMWCSGPIV